MNASVLIASFLPIGSSLIVGPERNDETGQHHVTGE
jgi:hypothetical protein